MYYNDAATGNHFVAIINSSVLRLDRFYIYIYLVVIANVNNTINPKANTNLVLTNR